MPLAVGDGSVDRAATEEKRPCNQQRKRGQTVLDDSVHGASVSADGCGTTLTSLTRAPRRSPSGPRAKSGFNPALSRNCEALRGQARSPAAAEVEAFGGKVTARLDLRIDERIEACTGGFR